MAQGRNARKARGGLEGPTRNRRSTFGKPMGDEKNSSAEARDLLLKSLMNGHSVKAAMLASGRSRSWYQGQRRRYPEWAQQVDAVKLRTGRPMGTPELRDQAYDPAKDPLMLSFAEFSEEYLGAVVPPHMLNVVDLIEGREPRWLHPSMHYEKGDDDWILCNLPVEHGKTATVSINYATYRVCLDPNVRILVVSKAQTLAKKILLGIKERLTEPKYAKLISTYGPMGGFMADAKAWTTEMIYVGGREAGEKDPTVQALGIGGQVYGSRADLIIIDDAVDTTNCHDYVKQINYVQSMLGSRLSDDGLMLMLGTRIATQDMYSEITNPDLYPDEESPWTKLVMPAVLEFDEDPEKWVTLWPRTNMPPISKRADKTPGPDGMFPKWDGPALAARRRKVLPNVWSRVYMQESGVEGEVAFPRKVVKGCTSGRRPGLIPAGMPGCRPEGMAGLIVVAGLDPASAGHTAAVVVGLDPNGFKRYVLDIRDKAGMLPDETRAMVYELTDKYGIGEWVIERNALQTWIAYDREMNDYLRARGCVVRPHFTGTIKHDPDFGVAAMAALFQGWETGHNLIDLPSTHDSEGSKALADQLSTWIPKPPKQQRTDTVMALWFAELACKARVQAMSAFGRSHARNPFLTQADRNRQVTLNLHEQQEMWRAV